MSDYSSSLDRQIQRYQLRFNAAFWSFFELMIKPQLPRAPVLADLGCGPGLYLQEISKRLATATLHGVDRDLDMLQHARALSYELQPPIFHECDLVSRLPFEDDSIDFVSIAAVMHTFIDPFAFLSEVERILTPHGCFLLYDWVRVPLAEFIEYRRSEPGDPMPVRYRRALEMFAAHNKYAADDWLWILREARFEIMQETWPYPRAIALLTRVQRI